MLLHLTPSPILNSRYNRSSPYPPLSKHRPSHLRSATFSAPGASASIAWHDGAHPSSSIVPRPARRHRGYGESGCTLGEESAAISAPRACNLGGARFSPCAPLCCHLPGSSHNSGHDATACDYGALGHVTTLLGSVSASASIPLRPSATLLLTATRAHGASGGHVRVGTGTEAGGGGWVDRR